MKPTAHSLRRLTHLSALAGLLGGVSGFAAARLPTQVTQELTQAVQPFFARHCTSCHGEQKMEVRTEKFVEPRAGGGSGVRQD